jgi:hypothetical protein
MRDAGVVDDITADAFADLAGRCTVFRVHTAAPPDMARKPTPLGRAARPPRVSRKHRR